MRCAELRRALLVAAVASTVAAPAADAAGVDVIRVRQTSEPGGDRVRTDVAAFPLTAAPGPVAATALSGPSRSLGRLTLSPDGQRIAYLRGDSLASEGGSMDGPIAGGLLPVAGGTATSLRRPGGRTLAVGAPRDRSPWFTFGRDGTILLHGTASGRGPVPWLDRTRTYRCAADGSACSVAAGRRLRDVLDLASGARVEVEATASSGERFDGTDGPEGKPIGRWLAAHGRRQQLLRVRTRAADGRVLAEWRRNGSVADGAPAYDRAHPSNAGVLLTTTRISSVRWPGHRRDLGAYARSGPALLATADGRLRQIADRLPYEVLGTLPDGSWIVVRADPRLGRPTTGMAIRVLHADGQLVSLRRGSRTISALWAAHAAGLSDAIARRVAPVRAAVDPDSGDLVLVVRDGRAQGSETFGTPSFVIVVPRDASTAPRVILAAPSSLAATTEPYDSDEPATEFLLR